MPVTRQYFKNFLAVGGIVSTVVVATLLFVVQTNPDMVAPYCTQGYLFLGMQLNRIPECQIIVNLAWIIVFTLAVMLLLFFVSIVLDMLTWPVRAIINRRKHKFFIVKDPSYDDDE
jgi:hypothetical protein